MPELRNVEVVAEGLAFPEGPVALSDGSVLVVELRAGSIARVGAGGRVDRVAEVGGGPNGAAIGPDGALYVCNNGGFGDRRIKGCIQHVDLTSGAHRTLYATCDGAPIGSPNDLVFDTTGHFYFTDHSLSGAIYYAAADGSSIRRLVDGVIYPNGIGLSPDGATLYWAETPTRQVQRRRIDRPGVLVESAGYNVRSLFRPGGADRFALLCGLPDCCELDSLAVDSAGAVVVGTLVDSGVSEITPDGSWTRHTLPPGLDDPLVTNVCFGGPDLTELFITCSKTGRLLRATWHRPGLALAYRA